MFPIFLTYEKSSSHLYPGRALCVFLPGIYVLHSHKSHDKTWLPRTAGSRQAQGIALEATTSIQKQSSYRTVLFTHVFNNISVSGTSR